MRLEPQQPSSPETSAPAKPNVVVIGGGAAGVSAAVELAERGVRVTLLEATNALGGKLKGWCDPAGYVLEHRMQGWWVEYVNFRDLLGRAGVERNLTALSEPVTLIHRNGIVDRLTFSRAPSPIHLKGMARGIRSVNWRGKLSAARAVLEIVGFDGEEDSRRLDGVDFSTWLRRAGVSAQASRAIFEPLLRSKLFLPAEQTSAASALNAVLGGLRRRDSWRFSWLRGNPGDYLWKPLAAHFMRYGGDIRLNSRAVGFRLNEDRATSVLVSTNGGSPEPLAADHVVMAVDVESCKTLVLASLNHIPFFNNLLNLQTTEVLVTRTWFQGDVRLRHAHALLVGFRLVDEFINVSHFQPELARPATLVIETQSYLGRQWMQVSEDVINDLVRRDLVDAFPQLENARVAKSVVTRPRGLYAAFGQGFETLRPASRTPLANLHLAGDWVRAPEPAMFMENAVVTGRHAASAVLEAEGESPVPIVGLPPPDAPVKAIRAVMKRLRGTRRAWQRLIGYTPIGEGEAT